MNQIECLTRSIEDKWIPIVEGKKRDNCGKDCVCCQTYKGCNGCPIALDIGDNCGPQNSHEKSSYWVYHRLSWEVFGEEYNYDLMLDLKAAAQMELSYLIDLRNRLEAKDG